MVPSVLALGKGSETSAPTATIVSGGLLTSTLPTLFVVPTVYTLFDDLGRRFHQDDRNFAPPILVEPTPSALGAAPAPAGQFDAPRVEK